MATTVPALAALLQSATSTNGGAAWSKVPPVPLTAGQRTNVSSAINGGTITTEADALALLATAALVSGAAPASITCTLASPGVITWTTHGLQIGQAFMLVGGTAPTGTSLWVPMFIVATGFGASAFQFSLTSGGASVNTSSTGTTVTAIPVGGNFIQPSQKQVWDYIFGPTLATVG